MKYDLVLEGGGAKGTVLVGAYAEFAQRQHTFGRLLGTSAGAITAALLAAGYSVPELIAALSEKANGQSVFTGFMGVPAPLTPSALEQSVLREILRENNIPLVPASLEEKIENNLVKTLAQHALFRHLFAFVEHGGWYSAEGFVHWLQAKMDTGTYLGKPRKFSALTLAQFHAITKVEMSLIASDTTAGRMLVLNHATAPDCPLVWAVRMSMSIPLLWEEVRWAKSWGLYRGQALTDHAIVDGGLLSNFPIELLVSDEPTVTAIMGPKRNDPIIGLLIDERTAVSNAPALPAGGGGMNLQALRTVQRINRLIDTAINSRDKMVVEAFADLVVKLPAGGYGTIEFDMSDARRTALLNAGRTAMQTYLDRPRPPADVSLQGQAAAAEVKRLADRVATQILEE